MKYSAMEVQNPEWVLEKAKELFPEGYVESLEDDLHQLQEQVILKLCQLETENNNK